MRKALVLALIILILSGCSIHLDGDSEQHQDNPATVQASTQQASNIAISNSDNNLHLFDKDFEAIISQWLELTDDESLTAEHISNVKKLGLYSNNNQFLDFVQSHDILMINDELIDLGESGAAYYISLKGFEHFTNLEFLEIEGIFILGGMDSLSSLANLEHLSIDGFTLEALKNPQMYTDVSLRFIKPAALPAANLAALESLSLFNTDVDDLKALSQHSSVKHLNINVDSDDELQELSNIQTLEKLELGVRNVSSSSLSLVTAPEAVYLKLSGEDVYDFMSFQGMENIKSIDAANAKTTNIGYISTFSGLEAVEIDRVISVDNPCDANEVFGGLLNLKRLYIGEFSINNFTDILRIDNLQNLDEFEVYSHDIANESLEPLRNCHNLRVLGILTSDITPIAGLVNLEYLDIKEIEVDIEVTDISPVGNMRKLKTLRLPSNNLLDLSVIKNLVELEELSFSSDTITDLSIIEDMSNLRSLTLYAGQLSDISALSDKLEIRELTLHGYVDTEKSVSDITPLKDLHKLETLSLPNHSISDVSILFDKTEIRELDLSGNEITDISPLADMRNLSSLRISRNPIEDYSLLYELSSLYFDGTLR